MTVHSECTGGPFRGTNGDERGPASYKMGSFQSLKRMEQIYTKRRLHIQFFFQKDGNILKLHLNTARLASVRSFPIGTGITFNIVRSVIANLIFLYL